MKKVITILSISLMLAAGSSADAQLSRAIQDSEVVGAQVGVSAERIQRLRVPLEAWQQRALDIANEKTIFSSRDTLEHIANGVSVSRGQRDFNSEFISSLSDQRLLEVLNEADSKIDSARLAIALKVVSEKVLARPSLETYHDKAHFTAATVDYITSDDLDGAISAFTQRITLMAKGTPERARAANCLAALTDPVVPDHYGEIPELIQMALDCDTSLSIYAPIIPIRHQIEQNGIAYFHPSKFADDERPLIAAARVCWEMTKGEELYSALQIAKESNISVQTTDHVQYLYGMLNLLFNRYDEAIANYEEVLMRPGSSEFKAYSSYRIGQAYQDQFNYVQAGVHYAYTIETFTQDLETVRRAEESLSFLQKSGLLIDMGVVQNRAKQLIETRDYSLNN